MGRGRAKAKQTKVARDLKYRTHETDFGALARELHGDPADPSDETPDLDGYTDPEICYRQARKHHAGLVVKSKDPKRVEELLNQYAQRFAQDFAAHVVHKDR